MDRFRQRIEALQGAFGLGADEMQELGAAVLERFPAVDASSAPPAYSALRICILEKALAGVPREMVDPLRSALARPGEPAMPAPTGSFTTDLERQLAAVETSLNSLQSEIEALPKGVIRERYAGGIASLFNITYLLRNSLTKSSSSDPDEHGCSD